jgi:AcrR family transcriptional regulator
VKERNLFRGEIAQRRRQPRQERAQLAVQRIKKAFIRIVVQEGYASASTNRIARLANLNIATLYRYFPNRQAIALSLLEDASSDLAQQVHDILLDGISKPLTENLRQLVSLLVDFLDREQISLLRLLEEVPELRPSAQALSLENLSYQTGYIYLKHHFVGLDEQSLRCKLFFVQHLAMGVLRSYVVEHPADLPRERFIDELTGLLVMYLQEPAVASFAAATVPRAQTDKRRRASAR